MAPKKLKTKKGTKAAASEDADQLLQLDKALEPIDQPEGENETTPQAQPSGSVPVVSSESSKKRYGCA